MRYCTKHRMNHEPFDCPRCAAEERHEELVELLHESILQGQARDQAAIQAVRDSEYKRANPGDYKCPKCLYITLNRGASRCPRCQAEIGPDHWDVVYRVERAQAEEKARRERLAAEEWARGEPERQRLANAAAEERERARQNEKREGRAVLFLSVYFSYFLPIIAFGSALVVLLVTNSERSQDVHLEWSHVLLVIPGLNWLTYISVLLFSSSDRLICLIALLFWATIGVFIYARIGDTTLTKATPATSRPDQTTTS